MSRTDQLLQEIEKLPTGEVYTLYEELAKRVESLRRASEVVARITGLGAGVWDEDAQDYVNKLREHDRH